MQKVLALYLLLLILSQSSFQSRGELESLRPRTRFQRRRLSAPNQPKGCRTAVGGVCTVCKAGYYLAGTSSPPNTALCRKCLNGCSECQNGAVCMECSSLRVKADDGKKCTTNYVLLALIIAVVVIICLALVISVWCLYKKHKAKNKVKGTFHPIQNHSGGLTFVSDRSFNTQNARQHGVSIVKEARVLSQRRHHEPTVVSADNPTFIKRTHKNKTKAIKLTTKKFEMKYVNLGRSGIKVSKVGYGNWTNSEDEASAQKKANAMVKLAFDNGINYFDTAEVYDSGRAERQLGIALKALNVPRSDYVVSTKIFGGKFPENTTRLNNVGTSAKKLTEGINRSLKNLGLDYVDIVFCHRYDEGTPTIKTIKAIKEIIDSGKAFYWATSTWPPVKLMEAIHLCDALDCPRPIAEQCQYNMLVRDEIENNYTDFFDDYGLGTTIWSPLCSGILTGKYNDGIPKDSRFAKNPQYKSFFFDRYMGTEEKKSETVAKLKAIGKIAKRIGMSQVQLALIWVLKSEDVSTAILGASKPSQLEHNLEALKLQDKVTPEILEEIEVVLDNRPERRIDYRTWAPHRPRR